MVEKFDVTMYTDGACSGNPGVGGFGTVLVYQDLNGVKHEKEFSAGYELTTNNQMELLAVITGFEALKKECNVVVYSDSKYVVDAFNNKWIENWQSKNWRTADKKPVKNVELWKRLLSAMNGHSVKYIWVKGHAGHEYNERCDRLAVNACKSEKLNPQIL